jgi:hypothetical protein
MARKYFTFGMEIVDFKLGIHTSMKSMHVWVTSLMFDANMDNHGVLQSIMEGVNV